MTAEDVAKQWERRYRRSGPALRNELRRMGQRLLQLSLITLRDEVYSKPEDVAASGKPKWRRTGNLLLSEGLKEDSFDSITLVNTAVYAHRRHEANKPGFPYKVNPARTAHWRDDAIAKLRAELPEAWERLQVALFEE